jgi:mRNA-degrading endonuclease toxin of MazEF toxin-antitoxin module
LFIYEQGDIVLVNFPLPDGFKLHPAVITSNEDVYQSEEYYIGNMITSSKIRDDFSFELTNEMVTKSLDKTSQVRCQLIALFNENEIERKISKLKKEPLSKLIKQINDSVFTI